MDHAAILLAAGSGTRMRGITEDKLLASVHGLPVFAYSLRAFAAIDSIGKIVIVYRDEEQRVRLNACLEFVDAIRFQVIWVRGGAERQDSVFNGLEALTLETDIVLIHDCARPLVKFEAIHEVLGAAMKDRAAVLAHRVTDTIKQTPKKSRGRRRLELKDLQRSRLWAMETPQAFQFDTLFDAYRDLRLTGDIVTDDTAVVSMKGVRVTLVENVHPNPKITIPEDLDWVEFLVGKADDSA